jgi:hypothetical protein
MAVFTVTRLGAGFLRILVQSPAGTRNLSHFESTETGPGTRPSSYSMGVEMLSPRIKRPGLKAYHSSPSNKQSRNSITFPSMVCTEKILTFTYNKTDVVIIHIRAAFSEVGLAKGE